VGIAESLPTDRYQVVYGVQVRSSFLYTLATGSVVIRHIVMWDVRGESLSEKDENIQRVQRCFNRLRGGIPGLITLEVGVDSSRADYACDVVLVTEFASQEALDAYATHPEHIQVKNELGDLRIARHQVDYAV
jgi:heme-degrading monooxygenase HmoA